MKFLWSFLCSFTFLQLLFTSHLAASDVYPECVIENDIAYPRTDICSVDKAWDGWVYALISKKYEALWDKDMAMIWYALDPGTGEDWPTLFVFNDGETEFAVQWTKDDEPINPVIKTVYSHWPDLLQRFNKLPKSEKLKIQQNLKKLEVYKGVPDGKWGRNTFIGVIAYNAIFKNKIAINNASEAGKLLGSIADHKRFNYQNGSLTIQPVSLANDPKAVYLRSGFTELNYSDRIAVQVRLKLLGIYHSLTNGLYDKNTEDGLNKFNLLHFENVNLLEKENVTGLYKALLNFDFTQDVSCDANPAKCSEKALCSNATHSDGIDIAWHLSPYSKPFVVEAKKRGLKCSVEFLASPTESTCENGSGGCEESTSLDELLDEIDEIIGGGLDPLFFEK